MLPVVSLRRFEPSAFTHHMSALSTAVIEPENAIVVPSGDTAGVDANFNDPLRSFAFEPSIPIDQSASSSLA